MSQLGERQTARRFFTELWAEVGPTGDPFHRCAVAHWLADLQDDVNEEVIWDSQALEAAEAITDERARLGGASGGAKGLFPSLHLNLGEA